MALHTLTEELLRKRVNLTHNNLEDVKSLALPGSYQEKVTTVGQSLFRFSRLKQLDLSRNSLSSLSGLENLKMLEKLNLYYNNISSLEELKKLQHNRQLQDVDLRLNPVTRSEPDYRLYLIQLLPNLQKLDDRCVRDRERQAAMMHFSDSPEFDISKNKDVDPEPQGNPRAKFVKDFVGGRTLGLDEMAVFDIISNTGKDVLPLRPLTGSTARQSAMEEYSFDALKQMGLNEKAQHNMATNQDSSKGRSAVLNKEVTERNLTETVHLLPTNKTSTNCQGTVPPPKYKSSSQKNGIQPPISLPITHEEEYQAYTKYTGHSHYTPCPDSHSAQQLPKYNGQSDPNNDNNYANSNTSNMVSINSKAQENNSTQLRQQKQFEKSAPTKNGSNDGDDLSSCSQSSQKVSLNSMDRLLLQLMDLTDKYWNGAQSLHRNPKFKSLAKDIIEKHFDNYSKHLCKGLQEQIYALTNQKEELTWQLSQILTNSSEVPSTNNKAKLENSLKTAYQNLEKINGQFEQSVQENKILRQKLANLETKSTSGTQFSIDMIQFEHLQKQNLDLCKDVEMLQSRLKQYDQMQALADMLKDSHNSLIRANNHLMAEIEESKTQHSAEVHQLQWNYEQLRQTMAALECISENPPTETGSLLSLAAETMSKPSVKLYDSDEKESLTFH